MVRKSLQRGLALGTSAGARDGAAVGAARREPVHSTNARSGKWLLWHFPLLGWHIVPWVASPGRWLQGHGALVGTCPSWGAYQGCNPRARGWYRAGQAGPCFLHCLDAELSSCPCSLLVLLWGCVHCRLAEARERESICFFSPVQGGQPGVQRNPWSQAKILSVSNSACPCFGRGESGAPSEQQGTPSPRECLQGCPLPSHTGTTLQTELPSPGAAEAGGIASPVTRSH